MKLQLTIGQKILLGYVLAMALLAFTGFAAYRSAKGLLQANRWVRHTFQVIGDTQEVRTSLLDLQNAGRGYVLTGDDAFLESMGSARARLAENRNLLRTLTMDNSVQQRRLDDLDPVIERGLADFAQTLTLRKERGFSAAQLALQQGRSRERMVQIQNSLTVIEDHERAQLNEWERHLEQSMEEINQTILYGSLLGLVLVALTGVVMHFSVTRPLADFQRFVTCIGEGDLTQRSAREGGDELGKLGRGLNQMVIRLRTMATQTRAATENLGAATMQILASARQQAAITGQQVAAYQETNATMQEVSQSGLQIAERAKQVTVTAEAVSIANTSGLDAV